MSSKMPIAIMIGRGSRLPAVLSYALKPGSPVEVKLVVSHKKLEPDGADVPGIALAKKHGIAACYFNLPNWRKKTGKTREEYDQALGWFMSQPYYRPELIFMTGWDLIVSRKFLDFFPWENSFYRVMNVHPGLLPENPEDDEVVLGSGEKIPAIRGKHGDDAVQTALDKNLPFAGSTIHFVTEKADVGPAVARAEVKVEKEDTVSTLYPRIQAEEDKMGPWAIDLFAKGKLKIENGRVKISK